MKGAAAHRELVATEEAGEDRVLAGGEAVCAAQEVAEQQGRCWVLLEHRHCAIP